LRVLNQAGQLLKASSDLPRAVANTKPGKTVPIEVIRKGKKKRLKFAIGEMPSEGDDVAGNKPAKETAQSNKIGLTLKALTPKQVKRLGGRNGLMVLGSEGLASKAGIRRGDVILGLNNSETQSVERFNEQINGVKTGKTIAILVYRSGDTLYIPIKIE